MPDVSSVAFLSMTTGVALWHAFALQRQDATQDAHTVYYFSGFFCVVCFFFVMFTSV